MSDTAMQEIADVGMVPISKAKPVDTTINHHARSIFAAFGNADNKQTRVVIEMAMAGVSCDMYDRIEAEAILMAKEADAIAGFIPKPDAKGSEKYGSKQASMRVQASMRRQVFGAARLNLSALVSIPASGIVNPDTYPTFQQAVNLARVWLHAQKIDWQGNKVEDLRRQRTQKADSRMWQQARDTAEQQNPQQPGETYAQWQARIIEVSQDIRAEIEDKDREKTLMAQAKKLFQEYGIEGSLMLSDMLRTLVDEQAQKP